MPLFMSSPAIMLPPMVLIKNGGTKNQAAALLFNIAQAITHAAKPPKMPVPKISPSMAAPVLCQRR